MNPADRRPEARTCGDDVAAYALGALDPSEVERFEAHLQTCPACREDLAAFAHVVQALPLSAPPHPAPKRLRRRVLTAVHHDSAQTQAHAQAQPRSSRRQALGWPAGALAAVAAALVLALVVAGGIAVLGSSGAASHVYAAQVTGVQGTARLSVKDGHAQLIVRHFSPPPPGKIYQVWKARPGQPPSSTGVLFSVTKTGNSDVEVPGSLHGVSAVLVTPEPAGGSKAPTHAPVIAAQLG